MCSRGLQCGMLQTSAGNVTEGQSPGMSAIKANNDTFSGEMEDMFPLTILE